MRLVGIDRLRPGQSQVIHPGECPADDQQADRIESARHSFAAHAQAAFALRRSVLVVRPKSSRFADDHAASFACRSTSRSALLSTRPSAAFHREHATIGDEQHDVAYHGRSRSAHAPAETLRGQLSSGVFFFFRDPPVLSVSCDRSVLLSHKPRQTFVYSLTLFHVVSPRLILSRVLNLEGTSTLCV